MENKNLVGENPLKTYMRHYAEISHKTATISIVKEIWFTRKKDPMVKRKKITAAVIHRVPLTETIPFSYQKMEVEVFDPTGFQTDDRFYMVAQEIKVYEPTIIKQIKDRALTGFNTEPIQI